MIIKTKVNLKEAIQSLIDYATTDDEYKNLEDFVAENNSSKDHIVTSAQAVLRFLTQEGKSLDTDISIEQQFVEDTKRVSGFTYSGHSSKVVAKVEKKFSLSVEINTDDDCLIQYKGKDYCFYKEDLNFIEYFDTAKECYEYLAAEVKILKGYKASEWLQDIMNNFINNKETSLFESGNQEIDIRVIERI